MRDDDWRSIESAPLAEYVRVRLDGLANGETEAMQWGEGDWRARMAFPMNRIQRPVAWRPLAPPASQNEG